MKSFGWIVAGLVAAAVGAGIWAAIAYYANFESGWVAWILGGLVGAAVAGAARERASLATGIGAACIAIAGILGGKYAAIRMELHDFTQAAGMGEVSEELLISYIADGIVQERMDAGETIEWPTEQVVLGEASTEDEYPPAIWADAVQRWESADDTWRDQHRTYVEYQTEQNMAAFTSAVSEQALLENLDIIDLVFFLLAVITAWRLGSGTSAGGGE